MMYGMLLSLLIHLGYVGAASGVAATAAATATSSCCNMLAQAVPGKVAGPSFASYNLSKSTYWSTQEQSLSPACVLLPTSAKDVARAVRMLADRTECPFAIKSGGHMAQAGAANIEGGITIDLGRLTDFQLDASKYELHIGPGVRWGQVYQELGAHNLSALGGRSADVGVGGLLLGGGLGYLSGHGWASDNVLEYEIVQADGQILRASQSHNTDIWKALKGGSSNLGIVTRYTLRVFDQAELWGGFVYYPPTTAERQFQTLVNATNAPYDGNLSVQISISYTTSSGVVFADQFLYARPCPNPPAMQPFLDIQPQLFNDLNYKTLSVLSEQQGALSPNGQLELTSAISFQSDLQTFRDLYAAYDSSVAQIQAVSGIVWSLTLEVIPPIFRQASRDKGGNILGTEVCAPGRTLILADLNTSWKLADDSATVEKAAANLLAKIARSSKRRGTACNWIDLNHAGAKQQVIESYGPSNVAFLRKAAARVDPKGMFQKQVPGGFKLP